MDKPTNPRSWGPSELPELPGYDAPRKAEPSALSKPAAFKLPPEVAKPAYDPKNPLSEAPAVGPKIVIPVSEARIAAEPMPMRSPMAPVPAPAKPVISADAPQNIEKTEKAKGTERTETSPKPAMPLEVETWDLDFADSDSDDDPALPSVPELKKIVSKSLVELRDLLILVLLGVVIGVVAFFLGRAAGRHETAKQTAIIQTDENRKSAVIAIPNQAISDFDLALGDLADGRGDAAVTALQNLIVAHPEMPSLQYSLGLAQLKEGELGKAMMALDQSIDRGERVSDAFTLKSVLTFEDRGGNSLQNVMVSVMAFLDLAVQADPANPGPRIEKALIARREGRPEAARQELEAARAMLKPIDSRVAIDVTLALLQLESGETSETPQSWFAQKFAAAAKAASIGDLPTAISALKEVHAIIDLDTFIFLTADPAFRPVRKLPEFVELAKP